MSSEPKRELFTAELKLSKAPIVEALVAIEFAMLSEEAFSLLPMVYESLAGRYARKESLIERQVQVKMPDGPISDIKSTGLRLSSNDGRYAVQLKRNAFVFSHLAPYESWRSFQKEARATWEAFSGVVGELQLEAAGLRYINKISYPRGGLIERYLRLYPVVPDSLAGGPQIANAAYMRFEFPLEDPYGQLVVQEVILPRENDELDTIALDNDFRFSILGLDEDKMWSLLERARVLKNAYFQHFITDELLESYR